MMTNGRRSRLQISGLREGTFDPPVMSFNNTDAPGRNSGIVRRFGGLCIAVLVVLFGLFLLWRFQGYTLDDSFITWRYGWNLVRHGSWNFNASGPNVEAYSSFIYALISIVPVIAGIGVLAFFKLFALAICCIFITLALWRRMSPANLTGILLVTLGNPIFVLNMWSGLETSLTVCLVAGGLYLAVSGSNHKHKFAFALVLILVSAVRSEGFLYALVVALVGVPQLSNTWRSDRKEVLRNYLRYFAVTVLPLTMYTLAYLIFRVIHFGELGTGPSRVKFLTGDLAENLSTNLRAFAPTALVALLVVFCLTRGVARRRLTLAWLGLGAIYGAVFMPSELLMNLFGRFEFMVMWPPLLAAVVIWVRGAKDISFARLIAPLLAVALLTLPFASISVSGLSNYYALLRSHGTLGMLINNSFPRDTVLMFGDTGLAPYLADVAVVDAVGLALPKPWAEDGPTAVMNGKNHGVIILVAKSADTEDLLLKSDGAHGPYDQRTSLAWARDHGYVHAGFIGSNGYVLHLWLSPELARDPRVMSAVRVAECRAEETKLPSSLLEVPRPLWPSHPPEVSTCG